MTGRMRFTILGCGASPGVPRIGNDWGACDPNEPRNRRLRSSLMVERFGEDGGVTRVIVNTGPDFREQVLRVEVGDLFNAHHAEALTTTSNPEIADGAVAESMTAVDA